MNSERGLALAMLSLRYMGLIQLVYMIPVILVARRRSETETARGLIVGASLTFLLNFAGIGWELMNRIDN